MAAFSKLEWSRFDVWAIVTLEGIAVVDSRHRDSCHDWLKRHEYTIDTIDFGAGLGPAISAFGELFQWERQFGYTLNGDRCNLDALRDGFDFEISPGQGHVLELLNPDIGYRENPGWFCGLLSIVREYSRCQLASEARFFVNMILDAGSPLVGVRYDIVSVPGPYSSATKGSDPFLLPAP